MKNREQALLYLKKAAEDERLVDEVIGSERVSDEMIGFHCQQAAEKNLKAMLSEMGVRFRKTHDLRELMDLLADHNRLVPAHLKDLDTLTPYGTVWRYDNFDDSGAAFDRQAAQTMIRNLRAWVEGLMKDQIVD